jgi:hypothetical protein
MRLAAAAGALILSSAGCRQECLALPCALPIALEVTVTAAGSGSGVTGASLEITGAESTTLPCDSSCMVPGYAGTYVLNVTAPGYQPAARTVVVQGSSPSCGCGSVQREQVSIVLTPTP